MSVRSEPPTHTSVSHSLASPLIPLLPHWVLPAVLTPLRLHALHSLLSGCVSRCMLSAPLILGNDPRHMNSATLDILLAPEVLAVSQDALALQARKVGDCHPIGCCVLCISRGGRVVPIVWLRGITITGRLLSIKSHISHT